MFKEKYDQKRENSSIFSAFEILISTFYPFISVYGVFAQTTIPIRTQFGPVEGVLIKDEVDEEATRDDSVTLQLTVQMETGKFYKLDVSNEGKCFLVAL